MKVVPVIKQVVSRFGTIERVSSVIALVRLILGLFIDWFLKGAAPWLNWPGSHLFETCWTLLLYTPVLLIVSMVVWKFWLHRYVEKKEGWRQFVAVTAPYWVEPSIKRRTRCLLSGVLLLLLAVNLLNLQLSYLNNSLMSAMQDIFQDTEKLKLAATDAADIKSQLQMHIDTAYQAIWYFLVLFAIGAVVVASYRWLRQRLEVHWRQWYTSYMCRKYGLDDTYYRLNLDDNLDNPDERLQDIKDYIRVFVQLLLDSVDSVMTILLFLGVLYSIYPALFGLAVVYPAIGTVLIMWLNRKPIKLKTMQLKKEGNFRFALGHLRRYAEQVAFIQGEKQEGEYVASRLDSAVQNFRELVNRLFFVNLGSKFYNYLIIVIPTLIMLPSLIDGKLKLGDLTQADQAFAMILASLSLVVSSVDNITDFLAQVVRLGTFNEALDNPPTPSGSQIALEEADHIEVENLTLRTPDNHLTLLKDLSLVVRRGEDLIISGLSGTGKTSFFRAVRRLPLWSNGDGLIRRPAVGLLMFLPQAPYMMMRASLRDQLLYPYAVNSNITDAEIFAVLEEVNLAALPLREGVGGLDSELDWANVLSGGEQQRLACARMLLAKPAFVFVDEGTSSLDPINEERIYRLLQASGTTFISIAHREGLRKYHKQWLELTGDGTWRHQWLTEGAHL
jgi:putative ATP-binding cassette transporter